MVYLGMQQYSYIDIKQNLAYFIFEKNPELCFVTFCLMYCKKKILIKEMFFFLFQIEIKEVRWQKKYF